MKMLMYGYGNPRVALHAVNIKILETFSLEETLDKDLLVLTSHHGTYIKNLDHRNKR